MDFNSLRDQVSNLTLYDLKAGVRKVQNGELMPKLEVGTITMEYFEKPLNLDQKADFYCLL